MKKLNIKDVYIGMKVYARGVEWNDSNYYDGIVVGIRTEDDEIIVAKYHVDSGFKEDDKFHSQWNCRVESNGDVRSALGAWDDTTYLTADVKGYKKVDVYIDTEGNKVKYNEKIHVIVKRDTVRQEGEGDAEGVITTTHTVIEAKYKDLKEQSTTKGYIVSNRTFGVEFECIGHEYRNQNMADKLMPRSIDRKGDGSLRGSYASEYVTPVLKNKAGEEYLHGVSDVLSSTGYTVNNSCGTHIHIGVENDDSYKTQYRLSRLAMLYGQVDIVLNRLVPSLRRKNGYCAMLNSGQYTMKDTLDKMKEDDALFYQSYYNTKDDSDIQQYKGRKEYRTRYKGINMNSIGYRGTVEIRYHQGTINSKEIMYWIDFNAGIIDYVFKNPTAVKSLVERLEEEGLVKKKLAILLEAITGYINPQTDKEIKKRFTKYNRVTKTCVE